MIRFSAVSLALLASANLALAGSSFNEVREVLRDQDMGPIVSAEEAAEQATYRLGQLPQYEVTLANMFVGKINLLKMAAKRTVTRTEDYYPRLPKLVHPNGICFTGEWIMTEESPYTGYFAQGKRGLFVGRASVAFTDTLAGSKRAFGFAGKIFPTDKTYEVVSTANFFTIDVLTGTELPRFADTALTNEPALGFALSGLWLGYKVVEAFKSADKSPGFRPVYPIAELGLENGQTAKTPKWIKIAPDASVAKVNEPDFRRELEMKYHPDGIRLNVYASDTTKDRTVTDGWQQLGYIQLNESYISYGCDRQLHFAHPKMK